jgi:3-carboxy-cis,cis-muconate cycloisomerase
MPRRPSPPAARRVANLACSTLRSSGVRGAPRATPSHPWCGHSPRLSPRYRKRPPATSIRGRRAKTSWTPLRCSSPGALDLIIAELEGIATALARLAEAHRDTQIAARTLLQQALPTTFGLKAAGWLVAILEAPAARSARGGLAAQLGGAAGTLASLGDSGTEVLAEFARELELAESVVPWHTDRSRIAQIGGALSLLSGVLGKISLDIILMAQTKVGEVSEPAGAGRGGSSTLPHKRNPILPVTAAACSRRVQDLARTLQAAMVQEHERAAGSPTHG